MKKTYIYLMKLIQKIAFLLVTFSTLTFYAQEKEKNNKIGLGTSLFNLNESFDNLFFYNNSSPIHVSFFHQKKYRIESILNLSIIDNKEERILKSRGSITLGIDFFTPLNNKVYIYYGPKVGYNTNETKLINGHIGGEYFFYKSWSISNELGLNYLIDFQNYLQTTSSVILRFYF